MISSSKCSIVYPQSDHSNAVSSPSPRPVSLSQLKGLNLSRLRLLIPYSTFGNYGMVWYHTPIFGNCGMVWYHNPIFDNDGMVWYRPSLLSPTTRMLCLLLAIPLSLFRNSSDSTIPVSLLNGMVWYHTPIFGNYDMVWLISLPSRLSPVSASRPNCIRLAPLWSYPCATLPAERTNVHRGHHRHHS